MRRRRPGGARREPHFSALLYNNWLLGVCIRALLGDSLLFACVRLCVCVCVCLCRRGNWRGQRRGLKEREKPLLSRLVLSKKNFVLRAKGGELFACASSCSVAARRSRVSSGGGGGYGAARERERK